MRTHELALAGTDAETVEALWGPRVAATHLPIREAVAPAIAAGEPPLAAGGPPIHDPDSPRIQRR